MIRLWRVIGILSWKRHAPILFLCGVVANPYVQHAHALARGKLLGNSVGFSNKKGQTR